MGIGTIVRHRLGRYEVPVAEFYRSRFINLDDLVTAAASFVEPKRILEIGCGEGAVADRLLAVFPDAEYLGIDIADHPGRMYSGDPNRATFRRLSSTDLVAEGVQPYDLVVLVDVVHHIPVPIRGQVLADAVAMTAATGVLMVKDWERTRTPWHLMTYSMDRYMTGDKNVRFATDGELRELLADHAAGMGITGLVRIAPHRNNILYVLSRTEPRAALCRPRTG